MSALTPAVTAVTTRLVLRDGSTAGVRLASPSDHDAMRRFFDELSPRTRRLRFLAPATASEELLERFCDNADPQKALTLIVCRLGDEGAHIIGVGSYFADSDNRAEVAFAVDDDFHGKGIATALLERLARAGADHDFEYFSAYVLPENVEMLDVFRDSGFRVHSTTEDGCVEVRLSLQASPATVAAADERDRQATIASLHAILQPRAVAVIGASRDESNLGRRVLEGLLSSGFGGQVYPVNPAVTELRGRRCYSSARDLPDGVDESFGNPRRFGQLARRVSRSKPIVVVKSGRTPAGLRAAASHTAGLAASELVVDGLFHQAGVIRAETIDEMFDLAACLDAQPLPSGRRVAILTNAGGPGILAADACSAAALDVLPTAAGTTNPVDLIASADATAYRDGIETLLKAEDVDAIIAIYTTIDSRRTAEILSAIKDGVLAGRQQGATRKPVLICTMATPDMQPLCTGDEMIPVYEFPEQAARALGKTSTYAAWRNAAPGVYVSFENLRIRNARDLCRQVARARGETWLTAAELHHLLQAADLQLAPGVLSRSADEAAGLARVFGFPVVAKLVSAKAVHKTEVGGVRLHLTNERDVRTAYSELCGIANAKLNGDCDGILIQPMMTSGTETLVGLTQDPTFGPLIAFGLGGVDVELFRDVAFRIAPLTDRDADDLLRSIRGFTLLEGYRNRTPADVRALRDVLLKISYLGSEVPELLELEFNPLIALDAGKGYQIVDVRARVREAV